MHVHPDLCQNPLCGCARAETPRTDVVAEATVVPVTHPLTTPTILRISRSRSSPCISLAHQAHQSASPRVATHTRHVMRQHGVCWYPVIIVHHIPARTHPWCYLTTCRRHDVHPRMQSRILYQQCLRMLPIVQARVLHTLAMYTSVPHICMSPAVNRS